MLRSTPAFGTRYRRLRRLFRHRRDEYVLVSGRQGPLSPRFQRILPEPLLGKGESMSAVPVIDIAAFLSGSPAKQIVAEAVDVACREVGFLVVEGHGVTQDLLTRMTESMLGFFKQPPLL